VKKLIYISILLTFGFNSVFGQGLYRLGGGTEMNSVQLVTPSDNSLFVFEVTTNSEYKLYEYDGFKYTDLGVIPNIPKHGISDKEDFKIVDARIFDNKLFVLGQDFGPVKSNSSTRILSWDGSNWKDLTTSLVSEAYSASKLVELKGKLCILGIFKSHGLLYYDAPNWVGQGLRMGTNPELDYVLDAETYLGRIYATGEFTRPLSGQRYNTAIFDNNEWRPVVTPPFIGKSKNFTIINGEMLLSGEANVEYDYLKSFNGIGWNDISSGLDDVFITEFWDIAGHNDMLCITGLFENKQSGERFNYMTKDAAGWHFGEQSFTTDKISLAELNGEIFAFGNFNYPAVKAIGEIGYHSAIISGKVYFDENDNCVQDGSEKGLELAKVILNPGNVVAYTDLNGNYSIPVSPGSYSITFAPGIKNDYGCGRIVSTNVTSNVNYEVPELNAIEKVGIVDLELSSQLRNGWQLVKGKYNEIQLNARNNGSVMIEGATLQLKMGDWWKDVTIVPTPNSTTNDEYIWNVSDLAKGETFTINISGIIKSELGLYNDFCFTGDVDFPQTDISTKSNRDAAQLTTTDELDPITKQVDCGSWFSTATEFITYQIRFENEANEVVNNLTIVDTFDNELVATTIWDFTDIGSTKQRVTKVIKDPISKKYRTLCVWNSTDAGLAPSGDASHKDVGYAQIKFELHNVSKVKGIELCNQAHVRLENSEPLYTNTVCSKVTSLSVPQFNTTSLVNFYPNPADQRITFKNNSGEERTVELMSQTGQLIHTYNLHQFEEITVNVDALASGIYLVNVLGFETQKLVIQ
jgi:hypothetical protein